MKSRITSLVGIVALAVVGLVGIVNASTANAAAAPATTSVAAVKYANAHGYSTAIAVLDTQTGAFYGAGNYNSVYATESVAKVFIATRLLISGQMTGSTESVAYKMITQSDDASANALYGQVGGDDLINWINSYFHMHVGSSPSRAGWWGNTHITAASMVRFYAAVKKNTRVWPWLYNAMSHAAVYGSDGTFQHFGIPSAASSWAVKEGWGIDDDCFCHSTWNSTGFVGSGRYAVAILTSGSASTYNAPISNMITQEAKILIAGGSFGPAAPPKPTRASRLLTVTGSLKGGTGELRGFTLDSANRSYRLEFQLDGNLVLYYGGHALWQTRTYSRGTDLLRFETDGNLALYHGASVVWTTSTGQSYFSLPAGMAGRAAATLVMQNDGNLVIYTPSGKALWSTRTAGKR